MSLNKIVTSSRGRLAQLLLGQGNNQQARASDVNTIIDGILKPPVIGGTAYATPTYLTASQSNATCLLNAAAGNVFVLPPAITANIGVTYRFYQTVTVTSNAAIIQTASTSDLFSSGSYIASSVVATPTQSGYSPNGSSNYYISVNGSTKGGIIGDYYEVTCIAVNTWLITGTVTATGTAATPFAG